MVVNVLQSIVVYAVGAITFELQLIAVLVKNVTIVTMRSELQYVGSAYVFIIALAVFWYTAILTMDTYTWVSIACQVPLADISGIVAGIVKIGCKGLNIGV